MNDDQIVTALMAEFDAHYPDASGFARSHYRYEARKVVQDLRTARLVVTVRA